MTAVGVARNLISAKMPPAAASAAAEAGAGVAAPCDAGAICHHDNHNTIPPHYCYIQEKQSLYFCSIKWKITNPERVDSKLSKAFLSTGALLENLFRISAKELEWTARRRRGGGGLRVFSRACGRLFSYYFRTGPNLERITYLLI